MKLVKGLALILAMSAGVIALPAGAEDFAGQVWSFERYLSTHPAQHRALEAFTAQVRAETPPRAKTPTDRPTLISVVYPGNQASDYWRRSVLSMERRLTEAGVPFAVESLFTQPGTQIRAQERYIAEVLRHDPDYLVFTLDALRHKAIVERLLGRDAPRIILQNITTPVKAWDGYQPFLYVGFDHAAGSTLLAKEYIRRTGGQGRYAVFFGPPGYVSQMRGDTFIQIVSQRSDLHLVSSYYVGFDRDKARAAARAVMRRHPDLRFIFACSTDIALGIADALTDLGLRDTVMVNGWGGGGPELDALQAGDLDFTVMRMNDDSGVAMADAIILDLSGRGAEVPTVYAGQIALISQDTDPLALAAMRAQAFRYSIPDTASNGAND